MHNDNKDTWEIAPHEVEALLKEQDPQTEIVDVREDYELKRGILPNAVHVPLSKFEENMDRWQPDRRYVIYCEHGIRSMDVVYWLAAKKQIRAKSMRGGFSVWDGPVSKPGGDV